MTLTIAGNLTRRVGRTDMVVCIRPEGLALRRHRQQSEALIMWEELFKQYLPARDPCEVFSMVPPARWLPEAGETIWVKFRGTSARRAVAVKVLAGCGEEIIRVRYRHREIDVLRSDTRPCADGKRKSRGAKG